MKAVEYVHNVQPLRRTHSWHSHKKHALNTTFLPNPKQVHKKKKRQNEFIRTRVPIWDKYLLVEDLLRQTKQREVTVSLYRYHYRAVRFGYRRHLYKIKFHTLRDWKTKFSKPDKMAKLRQAWLRAVRRNDTRVVNISLPTPGVLKVGRAPVLEEYMHWKHEWRAKLSMDRGHRWLKTEMKRVVSSPAHFTILRYLFEEDEDRVWRTLKFSWGYLHRIKVWR